jgi:hypothetical protein
LSFSKNLFLRFLLAKKRFLLNDKRKTLSDAKRKL